MLAEVSILRKDEKKFGSEYLAKISPLIWCVTPFFAFIYLFIGEHSYTAFKLSLLPLVAFSIIYKNWLSPMHQQYDSGDVHGANLILYKIGIVSYYILYSWILAFFVYFPLFYFFGISAHSLGWTG